jgi:hypothetical protein
MNLRALRYLVVILVFSCESENGGSCIIGDQDCVCDKDNTCNTGLNCIDGICRLSTNPGVDSAVPASGAGGDSTSASGTGGVVVGPSRDNCAVCAANQVCVDNSCVYLPAQCPCPVESYCDLASNTCVIGCTADEQCDVGRICFVDARICRAGCRDDSGCSTGTICENLECRSGCRDDSGCTAGSICENLSCRPGCREDQDCASGTICDNTVCREGCCSNEMCPGGRVCSDTYCIEGCRTTEDCTTAGAECIDAQCVCPQGLVPCDGACVDTNSNSSHCGTCGVTCLPADSTECRAGSCECIGGLSKCDGVCMDTQSDVHHCGSCTTDCGNGTGTVCSSGECINGSQPTSGFWAPCVQYSEEPADECSEGVICFSTVTPLEPPDSIGDICTLPCNSDLDCDPSPGGTATSICLIDPTSITFYTCVLLCDDAGGVPSCPEGMKCVSTTLGPICMTDLSPSE